MSDKFTNQQTLNLEQTTKVIDVVKRTDGWSWSFDVDLRIDDQDLEEFRRITRRFIAEKGKVNVDDILGFHPRLMPEHYFFRGGTAYDAHLSFNSKTGREIVDFGFRRGAAVYDERALIYLINKKANEDPIKHEIGDLYIFSANTNFPKETEPILRALI